MQRFRAHDEELLRSQHLIYDDDEALVASAHQARSELQQLFEADIEPDAAGVADTPDANDRR
jgi:glutathione-regulated potassium-efflux system protein KefB